MSDPRHVRNIVFPIWPDAEYTTDEVQPAADGRPWMKSCGECAFRKSDPQQIGQAYQEKLADGQPGTVFYCVHTSEENGDNRVCASYACLHRHEASPYVEPQP